MKKEWKKPEITCLSISETKSSFGGMGVDGDIYSINGYHETSSGYDSWYEWQDSLGTP